MEYYDYTVRLQDKRLHGTVTADDIQQAADSLKAQGFTVMEIGPMRDFLHIRRFVYQLRHHIKKKNIKDFFEQISFLLSTNLQMYQALLILRDSGSDKKLKFLARPLAEHIRKGLALHEGLERTGYYEQSAVMQVKAGEESGDVPSALQRLVKQYERELEFGTKIKNAMIYPAAVLIVMTVVLWVLLTVVVPSLSTTLLSLGGELPVITKLVIQASGVLKSSMPFLALGILFAVMGYKALRKKDGAKIDRYKRKIPIAGRLLTKMEMSRFCRNLSSIQAAGIALVPSLEVTKASVKNHFYRQAIGKAAEMIEISGVDLSIALSRTGGFPDIMVQLIHVGVSAGKVVEVLDKIALQFEKEIDSSIKKLTSLIEPILIVIVAILAGTIVLAMMLPMFRIMDTLM